MTKLNATTTGAVMLATFGMVCSPVIASQSTKNTWRNIGIGSAAVGILGLAHHNTGMAVLGVAGAAYSAHRYEQDRHHQSQARQRRIAREHWRREHHEG